MAKKQSIVKETAAAAAPSKPARAANPKTPRVKAAQHSKIVSTELSEPVSIHGSTDNLEESIAKIAYGYWETRGCQGGSAIEDWVRAEHEYRQHAGAARL